MTSHNILKVFLVISFVNILIVYSAPASDESILEYGPGYNTYGHQQMQVARLRGIRPVVDTIREDEKYGNDGGSIRAASTAFIRVSEGTSAALSNILGTPSNNTYNLLKPFEPILTDLGNRLGGLA